MSNPRIAEAGSDAEILATWPVMVQLRPHLMRADYVARVRRQMQGGYRLTALDEAQAVRACAGWRTGENLAWGTHVYVDDLVTDDACRSQGYGGLLLDWLIDQARRLGCDSFHLDSGVQRHGAHRFYLAKRLDITSHHFALRLLP